MKRIVFSLSVVRTPYQGRYFYIRAWTAPGPRKHFLAGRLPGLHHIVERPDRIRQIVQEILGLAEPTPPHPPRASEMAASRLASYFVFICRTA